MEMIAKVSKGTNMDQIYIPKKRFGMPNGSYVILKPIDQPKELNLYYHHIENLESIKVQIIREIFNLIDSKTDNRNIIIAGSFLEKGFRFEDIDIIIISDNKIQEKAINEIKSDLFDELNVKIQILVMNFKELRKGLSTDPLYESMLSRYVSKKRLILNAKKEIKPKILDLNLLLSKSLMDNFDYLDGIKKYYLTRNLIAISLFINNKKVTLESINKSIKEIFNLKSVSLIKNNLLDKEKFMKKYREIYEKTFNEIMGKLNDTKQKRAD